MSKSGVCIVVTTAKRAVVRVRDHGDGIRPAIVMSMIHVIVLVARSGMLIFCVVAPLLVHLGGVRSLVFPTSIRSRRSKGGHT